MHRQAVLPVLPVLIVLTTLTALTTLFTACEKVPDYCSRGNRYDPEYQFCFAGKAYPLCKNGNYNPLSEGCDKNNAVGTRCADGGFVPPGTPCNGYTLTTASVPENGGTIKETRTGEEGTSYTAGEQVVLAATAKDGYTFAGWAGAETSQNATITFKMDDNKPIVAMFNPKSAAGATAHVLVTTAFPDNGGTVTRNLTGPEYNTGTQVSVTATAAQGYTFSGWSGASTSKTSPVTINMDAGKTLVAMFTPIVYTLTVNANPKEGGAVFVNGTALVGAAPQNAGTTVEAHAQPAAGYVFTGWSGAATSKDERVTIDITGSNQTLTANFKQSDTPPPTTYALKVNINPAAGGAVTRNPENSPSYTDGIYTVGEQVTVTATAATGYTFSGWTGTGPTSANPVITVTMDRSHTLNANFQLIPATYTLTVGPSPVDGGSVTRNPNNSSGQPAGTYTAGTQVTVTAAAAGGYRFVNWTGGQVANANNMSTTIVVNANVVLTANFAVYTGGGDSGVVRGDTLTDSRDGKKYLTVIIDGKRWMAENLNYAAAGSKCGGTDGLLKDENTENCDKYGRLYTWDAAISACPSGWHLPSDDEWEALVKYVDPNASGDYENVAGTKLKSKTGWYSGDSYYIPGTDAVGFSALPGGYGNGGSFYGAGLNGYWWSATEDDAGGAWNRSLNYLSESVYRNAEDKTPLLFAARCAQDFSVER